MKNRNIILYLSAFVAFFGLNITQGQSYVENPHPNCSIDLRPYNKNANEITQNKEQSVIYLTDTNQITQSTCRTKIPYGKEQIQQGLHNYYKQFDLENNGWIKDVVHRHIYLNNNKQDDKSFYRSSIFAFEIDLESDALLNMKTTNTQGEPYNLTCSTPYPAGKVPLPQNDPLAQCNGYNKDIWGGTLVRIIDRPEKNKKTIEWRFGVDENGNFTNNGINKVPKTYGENKDLTSELNKYLQNIGITNANYNLSDNRDLYRIFQPAVGLNTKDLSQEKTYWTTTTTSRILVINYAIDKSSLNLINNNNNNRKAFFENECNNFNTNYNLVNKNNEWLKCTNNINWNAVKYAETTGLNLPNEYKNEKAIKFYYQNQSTVSGLPTFTAQGENNYSYLKRLYWIPIGSVSTVWKAEPTPKPNECKELKWANGFCIYDDKGSCHIDQNNRYLLQEKQSAFLSINPIFENGKQESNRPLQYFWMSKASETAQNPNWYRPDVSQYFITNATRSIPIRNTSSPTQTISPATVQIGFIKPTSAKLPQVAFLALTKTIGINLKTANAQYSYAEELEQVQIQRASDRAQVGSAAGAAADQASRLTSLKNTIGFFKDSISRTVIFNPFATTMKYVYYEGGVEGTVVGVQAYYNDGQNIEGHGPLMNVPLNDGTTANKQIAHACYLEFIIGAPPAICTDLQLNPSSLVPKQPTTFTVTPTFSSENRKPTLRYVWEAKSIETTTFLTYLQIANKTWANNLSIITRIIESGKEDTFTDMHGYFTKGDSDTSRLPIYQTNERSIWYSGGPAGTEIFVYAEGLNGELYDNCKAQLIIPPDRTNKICKNLESQAFLYNPETNTLANNKTPWNELRTNNAYLLSANTEKTIFNDDSLLPNWKIQITNQTQNIGKLLANPSNNTNCKIVRRSDIQRTTYTQFIDPTNTNCSYFYYPEEGDELKIFAYPHNNVKECRVEQIIPREEAICKEIDINITDQANNPANLNSLKIGNTYAIRVNPEKTVKSDNTRIENFNIFVKNETGVRERLRYSNENDSEICKKTDNTTNTTNIFYANIPIKCTFLYTPEIGDTITVQANPHDSVKECSLSKIIPDTPQEDLFCANINLQVNERFTNRPQLEAGKSYNLTINPRDSNDQALQFVTWRTSGSGILTLDTLTSNISECMNDIKYTKITSSDGPITVPSVCRYIFTSRAGNESFGFSAKVETELEDIYSRCEANSGQYTPPKEESPYCVLMYFVPGSDNGLTYKGQGNYNFNVGVILSDGSKYNDQVRFASTDNQRGFGTNNQNPFLIRTDANNRTGMIAYSEGQSRAQINITLASDIRQNQLCQLRLNPLPEPPKEDEECTIPPRIVAGNSNEFCDSTYGKQGAAKDICWTVTGTTFAQGLTRERGRCVTIIPTHSFTLEAEDCEGSNICRDRINQDRPPRTPDFGLEKFVKDLATNTSNFLRKLNFSTTGNTNSYKLTKALTYKLTLNQNNINLSGEETLNIIINDPIFSTNGITGKKEPSTQNNQQAGNVKLSAIPKIKFNNNDINKCNANANACYEINENSSTLTIKNIKNIQNINIEYDAILTSGITKAECQNGTACKETFINTAKYIQYEICEKGECIITNLSPQIISNNTEIDITCQYFLTRASGDVFLEGELTYGVDISKCYPYKNVSSVIVRQIEVQQQVTATGTSQDERISITNQLCSDGIQGLYGDSVSGLSSQICEIAIVPGTNWTKSEIIESIKANVKHLTRWLTPSTSTSISLDNAQNSIIYVKGDDNLKIFTLINANEYNDGPLTVIVENADLYINSDIKYGNNANSSLGFIILNGNLIIDPSVKTLSGAFFVQGENGKGKIQSGKTSNGNTITEISQETLTVYGSIFGDIGELFEKRQAGGAVQDDAGAITIRYDKRIIDNPPPGLTELFDSFSQRQTVR